MGNKISSRARKCNPNESEFENDRKNRCENHGVVVKINSGKRMKGTLIDGNICSGSFDWMRRKVNTLNGKISWILK